MPGGSLTINVPDYKMLAQVAQSITCWAGGPGSAGAAKIKVVTGTGPSPASFVIPEELWATGALVLKRGGTNIVSGLVAGSNTTYYAGNGLAMTMDPNTCAARTNQPTITSVTNTGLSSSIVYANVAAAGTVDFIYSDGTQALAQAESGTVVKVWPSSGIWTITIRDTSVPTDASSQTITVP